MSTMQIRRSAERGHFNHGWLDTYHTFSFGGYQDADHVQFRSLRVMNEDRVSPGMGFGEHPHRDMEILTWVLSGELTHRDSLGHESTITPAKVQVMSAGTGIRHSEVNQGSEPVHLYQIWLLPREQGRPPRYEEKAIPPMGERTGVRLIASPDGADGSATIEADAKVFDAWVAGGETYTHRVDAGRHVWVQVAVGEGVIEGEALTAGDGMSVSGSADAAVELTVEAGAEGMRLLIFDLD